MKTIYAFAITLSFSSLIWTATKGAATDTICFVYVSLRGDDSVAVYKANQRTGALAKIYSEHVNGGPASMAISPSKHYLYIAQRASNSISSYSIDKTTGRLTLINTIPAVDNPVYISTDKTGNFLLSAYFGANKAAVYPIEKDGSLQGTATQVIETGMNPHAIATDPTNKLLYITNMTGNKILQYQFNEITGNFSALQPTEVLPPEGTGPRHMAFSATKKIMYVVNEKGSSITAYHIADTDGSLVSFQTISTLPPTFGSFNKSADIHITPDNKYLYASNRGHESIAAFRIDPSHGNLSTINQFPTVNTPRAFDIDPTGSFLYVAGETSNNVAYYKINKTTGELEYLGDLHVGNTPSWVLIVRM